jgi:hypothetical protein
MNTTFRCVRSLAYLGLCGVALVPVLIGLLYFAFTTDLSDLPLWLNLLGLLEILALLLGCSLGGPAMIVFAIRHRLTISGSQIQLVGILRTVQIDLAQVTEARWRRGGKLVLRGAFGKLGIELSYYPAEQVRQLIKYFHLQLPAAVQQGWDKYWRSRWQLFDMPDPARREEFAEKTRALRARLTIWVVVGAMLCVGTMVVVWRYTGDIGGIAPILFCFPLLVLLAFLARADRAKIAEKTVQPRKRLPVVMVVASNLLLMVLMLALTVSMIYGIVSAGTAQILLYSGAGVAGILMVFGVILAGLRGGELKRARAEGAKLAEHEYMQREEESTRE